MQASPTSNSFHSVQKGGSTRGSERLLACTQMARALSTSPTCSRHPQSPLGIMKAATDSTPRYHIDKDKCGKGGGGIATGLQGCCRSSHLNMCGSPHLSFQASISHTHCLAVRICEAVRRLSFDRHLVDFADLQEGIRRQEARGDRYVGCMLFQTCARPRKQQPRKCKRQKQ